MSSTKETASRRDSYVGALVQAGSDVIKGEVLESLPEDLARLHTNGDLHIHDLEAFGRAANCLTMDIRKVFRRVPFPVHRPTRGLFHVFNLVRDLVANMANEQSGGLAFGNFDEDVAWMLEQTGWQSPDRSELLAESVWALLNWINNNRARYGMEPYYVTINFGLSTHPLGRVVSRALLDYYQDAPTAHIRPNLVFKVKSGVNWETDSPNHDLMHLAMTIAGTRMNPNFLLCDSAPNRAWCPAELSVMCCRTRLLDNLNGRGGSLGRGNAGYVTVNLPRLAHHALQQNAALTTRLADFCEGWNTMAAAATRALLERHRRTISLKQTDMPATVKYQPWVVDTDGQEGLTGLFKHATLSLSFVGLAEAVEILTGHKMHASENAHKLACEFGGMMRNTMDHLSREYGLNFTLLATPAESAAGRFAREDWRQFAIPQAQKGFYTNSFHVEVDADINAAEKFRLESLFHELCNEGCISYVELDAPPFGNPLAVRDIIDAALSNNISLMGINFPLDSCQDCGTKGVYEVCPDCAGTRIQRIRRVAGYLEELDYFSEGKKLEEKLRKPHVRARGFVNLEELTDE